MRRFEIFYIDGEDTAYTSIDIAKHVAKFLMGSRARLRPECSSMKIMRIMACKDDAVEVGVVKRKKRKRKSAVVNG